MQFVPSHQTWSSEYQSEKKRISIIVIVINQEHVVYQFAQSQILSNSIANFMCINWYVNYMHFSNGIVNLIFTENVDSSHLHFFWNEQGERLSIEYIVNQTLNIGTFTKQTIVSIEGIKGVGGSHRQYIYHYYYQQQVSTKSSAFLFRLLPLD